jgi:hypothetical protein
MADASFSWGTDADYNGVPIDEFSTELWLPHVVDDDDLAKVAQRCPRLEELYLGCYSKNGTYNVTDAGLRHLARLSRLVTLDLSGCNGITDAGLLLLARLPLLARLEIDQNVITAAGIAAFTAAQAAARGAVVQPAAAAAAAASNAPQQQQPTAAAAAASAQ